MISLSFWSGGITYSATIVSQSFEFIKHSMESFSSLELIMSIDFPFSSKNLKNCVSN